MGKFVNCLGLTFGQNCDIIVIERKQTKELLVVS